MVLTRGDDFPIHQTSEPIAYAGTDRNFYDRYFFNGYAPHGDDAGFFALAFGVYPHLNVADAAFVVVRDGVQIALHASKILNMERMDLQVGPIGIEVVVPLHSLRLRVTAPEQAFHADILFTARAAPIEEPRFTRRIGPRAFMDYTRLTQNGHYAGWIEVDGVRRLVDGHVGTRDRSWGVRPIGARDSQEIAPPAPPQFFWLWAPVNFEDGSLFFHTNDDAMGARGTAVPCGRTTARRRTAMCISIFRPPASTGNPARGRPAAQSLPAMTATRRPGGRNSRRCSRCTCSAWATDIPNGDTACCMVLCWLSGKIPSWRRSMGASRNICTFRRCATCDIAMARAACAWGAAFWNNLRWGRMRLPASCRCWTWRRER